MFLSKYLGIINKYLIRLATLVLG